MRSSGLKLILLVVSAGLVPLLPSSAPAWNLTHLASYNPPNHELLDIEISEDYAYVPAGLGGLSIIDISDPSSPFSVATYSAYGCDYGRLYAWHVQGMYAYGSGRDCGIKVLDVKFVNSPQHIGDYGTPGKSYEHTDGSGDYLFAATHTDGVEIINVSVPSSPQFVSEIATENAWAVEEVAGLLYVADGTGGLKIIDVTDPLLPQLLGSTPASGTAKDVVVQGDYAFVAAGAFGVDMFDVSNPLLPTLVANYNTTGYASRVGVSDSLIAVSDWDDVEVLRWDDSPSLSLAGYKNTNGRVMAINMVDDVVFSAEWGVFRTFQFGPIAGPDLDLSIRIVDFPHTEIDSCSDTTLTLMNNGQTELTILNTILDGPGGGLLAGWTDFSFSLPETVIAPGMQVEGAISYCA
jgi:hypothetical protein